MVFDPFRDGRLRPDPNPNLPPGSVPPGARFDPIGPPGTGRFPGFVHFQFDFKSL